MNPNVPLPRRLAGLPTDRRGFVVPFFVQWFEDGKRTRRAAPGAVPDFRVVDRDALVACLAFARCWLCGQGLGSLHAHVIGPMCAVNRVTSEPGSHRDCAEYAVRACPFLVRPAMRRNPSPFAETVKPIAGIHVDSNPGVVAIWTTKGAATPFHATRGNAGMLLELGEPACPVRWYREGRPAGRAEVESAMAHEIESVLKPDAEAEGERAALALAAAVRRVRAYLPTDGVRHGES